MKIFTDNTGQQWSIAIDYGAARRCKDLAGVDLMQAVDKDSTLIADLSDNTMLLVDTLYAICKPQADQRRLTDEQFGALIVGDAIDAATTAFMEDLPNFFPSHRRQILTAALKRVATARDQVTAKGLKMIDAAATKALAKALADMDSIGGPPENSGSSQTVAPDSSASSPTA